MEDCVVVSHARRSEMSADIGWWSGRWSIGSAPQFCAECRCFHIRSSHGDPASAWDSWNLTFQNIGHLGMPLLVFSRIQKDAQRNSELDCPRSRPRGLMASQLTKKPSMYYHGLCTTIVYVLPMVYVCTTTVDVLPWSMYYHGLCTTMVYVPSLFKLALRGQNLLQN